MATEDHYAALLNQNAVFCLDHFGFQQGMCRTNRGVSGEGQLGARCEDAYVVVRTNHGRWDDKGCLRQVGPVRNLLHLGSGEVCGVEDDCNGVALEGGGGKYVDCFEGVVWHGCFDAVR